MPVPGNDLEMRCNRTDSAYTIHVSANSSGTKSGSRQQGLKAFR